MIYSPTVAQVEAVTVGPFLVPRAGPPCRWGRRLTTSRAR